MDTHLMTKYRRVDPGDVQRGDFFAHPAFQELQLPEPDSDRRRVVHVEGGHAFTINRLGGGESLPLSFGQFVREVDTITVELERETAGELLSQAWTGAHMVHVEEAIRAALDAEEES